MFKFKTASATAGAIAPSRPVEPGRGPMGNPIAMGTGGTPINTGAGTGVMGSRLASGGTSTNLPPGQEAAQPIDPKELEKAQQEAQQSKAQLEQLKAQTSMQKLEAQHASRMGGLSSGFAKGHALKAISGMQGRLQRLNQRALGSRFKFATGIPGAPVPMAPDLLALSSPTSRDDLPSSVQPPKIKPITEQEATGKAPAPYIPRLKTRSGQALPSGWRDPGPQQFIQAGAWKGPARTFEAGQQLKIDRALKGQDTSTGDLLPAVASADRAQWQLDHLSGARDWSDVRLAEPAPNTAPTGSLRWAGRGALNLAGGAINSAVQNLGQPAANASYNAGMLVPGSGAWANEWNHWKNLNTNGRSLVDVPINEMVAPDGVLSNLGRGAVNAAHTVFNTNPTIAALGTAATAYGNHKNEQADTAAFVQQEQANQEQRVAARQQFEEGPPPDTGIMEWLAQLWASIAPYLTGQASSAATPPLPSQVGSGGHAVRNYQTYA